MHQFLCMVVFFPQTVDVLQTRILYKGLNIEFVDESAIWEDASVVVIQNPDLYGNVADYTELITKIKHNNCFVIMVCDLLHLVINKSPGDMGADVAIGSTQRFGVPVGFGGPSAGYIACKDIYKRFLPGRIIGLSRDINNLPAFRMALQTREQHIRRHKATSNICTAQVLLAHLSAFYTIYHGYQGLCDIALRIWNFARLFYNQLSLHNIKIITCSNFFDTVSFTCKDALKLRDRLLSHGYLVANIDDIILVNFSETSSLQDISMLLSIITGSEYKQLCSYYSEIYTEKYKFLRTDSILTHPVFNQYHTETMLMRYIKKLERKDFSLVHGMIPLGSCTMKLNSATSLIGLSLPHFSNIHPFTLMNTACGYTTIINELSNYLQVLTGFPAISFQPNSGSQGEFAGLLAIRRYNDSIGEVNRNVCLIPASAHGTNPASAVLVGLKVVTIACDDNGNIDINALTESLEQYAKELFGIMITYPSTHGVFEDHVKNICKLVHQYGGHVYLDGANFNAMVGITTISDLGADVAHLNLHKTFAIPHGGGGPGVGPIGVRRHLIPFLPSHVFDGVKFNKKLCYAVSSSPYGSASILLISWMYIKMLGLKGVTKATKIAILNANYLSYKIGDYYKILYSGKNNYIAHECIIDLRNLTTELDISEVDIAKRLIDYEFHAPTVSFPIRGTMMFEPTESESLYELDRFIDAMVAIFYEIEDIRKGILDKHNNPIKNAPHTLYDLRAWDKPYSIDRGCFPTGNINRFFASVNRVDEVYGDRNFCCSYSVD